MEVQTGVDTYWIADATLAFKELIARAVGQPPVEDIAALCAEFADAMAAERQKRGGVRESSDIREHLAVIQEAMPAALAFFEQLHKMGEKNRKHQDE
jgi:tRNA-dihydrouridine synthase